MNGALTLGESIADVAGLVVAHDAYQRSLDGKPAPVLDSYTADQRFFMAYAQAWRWKGRDAAVDQLMKTDPHPPSSARHGRSTAAASPATRYHSDRRVCLEISIGECVSGRGAVWVGRTVR